MERALQQQEDSKKLLEIYKKELALKEEKK